MFFAVEPAAEGLEVVVGAVHLEQVEAEEHGSDGNVRDGMDPAGSRGEELENMGGITVSKWLSINFLTAVTVKPFGEFQSQ